MKLVIYALPAALCLLIGIVIGYRDSKGLATLPPPAKKFSLPKSTRPPETSLPSTNQDSSKEISPTSIENLQALEQVYHEVPGKALTDHLPRLFESSYEVSGTLSALMELSGEEEDQLNEFLSSSIDELGKMESEHADQRSNANGDVMIHIPSFSEGEAIRDSLLARVESHLGSKRRALLEMHLLNNSGIIGDFGSEAVSLSLPDFEDTHKREDLITLKVGLSASSGSQEVFEDRAFFIRNFKKRFGHLFELKTESGEE